MSPDKPCNWSEHETIRGSIATCPIDHLIQMDLKLSGDKSVPVKKEGQPKKLANSEDGAAGADMVGQPVG